MSYYVNTTGKMMAAAAVAGVATGNGKAVARGCLGGLVAWLAWVSLVLYGIYWLVFK